MMLKLISARDEFKIKYDQLERDVLLLNERVWYIYFVFLSLNTLSAFCTICYALSPGIIQMYTLHMYYLSVCSLLQH